MSATPPVPSSTSAATPPVPSSTSAATTNKPAASKPKDKPKAKVSRTEAASKPKDKPKAKVSRTETVTNPFEFAISDPTNGVRYAPKSAVEKAPITKWLNSQINAGRLKRS